SDYLSAYSMGSDHLAGEATDPPTKKKAPLITSLPGALNADEGLAVADHSYIEQKSQRNKEDAAFQAMDEDKKRGFTFKSVEDNTDYQMRKSATATNRPEDQQDNQVHIGEDAEITNKQDEALREETGIKTLGQYRAMVIKDFNFGAVVNKYAGKGGNQKERFDAGKTAFIADVVARFYPKNKVGDPETKIAESVALNIWSYATRGQDVQGGMDIGELQGLLYVFDKQIKKSSDSNTKMSKGDENTFIVPGTEGTEHEVRLQKGDDRHGRATILTTRHLLADMTQPPPDNGMGGFDESYMLFDKSSSMQTDEFKKLGQMMNRGEINGSVSLAGFDGTDATLAKVQDGAPLTPAEAGQILNTASGEASSKPAVRTTPEISDGSGELMNEQGMANALKWAKSLPRSSAKKRQMVVVTDEPDFNPAVLPELQKIAQSKNLSIKILYSFNSKAKEGSYGGVADKYVLVDLLQIKSADDFIVDRMDATQRNESGGVDGSSKTLTQQMDWSKAATAQGAKVRDW
ncbi:MAG: hypothetical protein ACI9VR_001743, partial [Cognaticolwellia sp.]